MKKKELKAEILRLLEREKIATENVERCVKKSNTQKECYDWCENGSCETAGLGCPK